MNTGPKANDRPKLNFAMSKDTTLLRLSFQPGTTKDGETPPPIAVAMEAAEVDALIKHLGKLRSTMVPARSSEPPAPGFVAAVHDPVIHVWSEAMHDDPGLTILHPGFGWLDFVFPREKARLVAAALQRELEKAVVQGSSRSN